MNTPRNFTSADLAKQPSHIDAVYLYVDRNELIHAPLPWQVLGLSQTASGYGAKLTTQNKVRYNGRDRRIYATIYGNNGSTWIQVKGQRIYVA